MRTIKKLLVVLLLLGGTLSAQNLQYVDSEYWIRANDVMVADSVLFCAYANGIQIIDISAPSNPHFISKSFCPGYGSKLCADGNYIYLADGTAGLQVIDISDISNPRVVGSCPTPSFATDICILGNYAYMADSSSGLQIINIANPLSPVFVSSLGLPANRNANYVSVADNIVYLGTTYLFGDPRVTLIDISNPLEPAVISEITIGGSSSSISSISIIDTIAYIAAGSFYVYNISNRSMPTQVSWLSLFSPLVDLKIRGNYGYGVESENHSLCTLITINFDNLLNPVLLSTAYIGNGTAAIAIKDSCVFTGATNGIEIYDILDLQNINLISRLGSLHNPSDIGIEGNYAYLADGFSGNLEIADISDLTQITPVATLNMPDYPFGISVAGSYAFIADYGYGLQIVNIENPLEPELEGEYIPSGRTFDVSVIGQYAYLANFDRGLEIVDVSNPSVPTLASEFVTGNNTLLHIDILGDYAYLGSDREMSLDIVDISNHVAPLLVGTWGQGDVRGIAVSGNYIFMAIGNNLFSVDATDPSHPVTAGELTLFDRGCTSLEIANNLAFVGSYFDGIKIVDISSPANMQIVSEHYIPGWIYRIRKIGEYFYILSEYSLSVFEMIPAEVNDNPSNPIILSLSQNYPNPFNAQTTISYSLSEPGPVTLTIYNLLGQKLATLFDGIQTSGEHSLVWNAGNQPSGVYFCRLNTAVSDHSETMLLLK